MKHRSIIARLLLCTLLIVSSFASAQWQEEDYAAIAKIISSLKILLQRSPAPLEVERELSLIPNSKPYIKSGVYQGQVLVHDGKEIIFFFATYQNGKAASANIVLPPIKREERQLMYKLLYHSLSNYYTRVADKAFDIGNGYRAYLDESESKKSYGIQILKP